MGFWIAREGIYYEFQKTQEQVKNARPTAGGEVMRLREADQGSRSGWWRDCDDPRFQGTSEHRTLCDV